VGFCLQSVKIHFIVHISCTTEMSQTQNPLTPVTSIPLIPIVVFNNSAELKVHVSNHIVVNRCNLNWAISQYHDIILNATQVDRIVNTIQRYYTIADKEEIRLHEHNVYDRQYRAKSLIRQGVCPQCGGQLVLRKGRYGSFYGCSNYPKCKFTLNK